MQKLFMEKIKGSIAIDALEYRNEDFQSCAPFVCVGTCKVYISHIIF